MNAIVPTLHRRWLMKCIPLSTRQTPFQHLSPSEWNTISTASRYEVPTPKRIRHYTVIIILQPHSFDVNVAKR